MAGNINPINVNTQALNANYGFGAAPKKEEESLEKKAGAPATPEQKPVSADATFNYMAATAAFVPTKTVNPAKYVDEASAARIASFMGSFEDKVAEGLAAFDKEFAGMNISDNAKMGVVLAQLDRESL